MCSTSWPLGAVTLLVAEIGDELKGAAEFGDAAVQDVGARAAVLHVG
jgi:hypothetical protein